MKQVHIICDIGCCYECPMLARRFLFWWECTEEGLTVSRSELHSFPAFCDLEDVEENVDC